MDENLTGQALADLIHCQQTSSGYKIKHGKHTDEQAKGESIETKQYQDMLYGMILYTRVCVCVFLSFLYIRHAMQVVL